MDTKIYTLDLEGKTITATFSNLVDQAGGAVMLSSGGTVVLATACMSKDGKNNPGFFNLTVEYVERNYAAGLILGGQYNKREGRPSDEAVLSSRIIDRTIRPFFETHIKNAVQVVVTVLSLGEMDPAVLGINAVSLALSVSPIPWNGPVGAVLVGKLKGKEGIGASEMFGSGPRAQFAELQSRLFLSGRQEHEVGADQFDVPDQLKEDAARYGSKRAAIKATDSLTTIGQLVDQARDDGLALLAVTVNFRRYKGRYLATGHIVGYSPSRGLYDTSVATHAARARFIHGAPEESITGLEWFAHGQEVPHRTRHAAIWVFFRGE
jgi:hypothetical protein